MIRTEASIIITAPIEAVFAVASDFNRAADGRKNLRKSGFKDNGAAAVGAECDWVVKFGWQTMDLGGVVTAWDPPNGFAWRPLAGPFLVTDGMTFVADGNSTKVTTYSDSEPTGAMKMMSGLMTWFGERQYRKELQALKEIIETTTWPIVPRTRSRSLAATRLGR